MDLSMQNLLLPCTSDLASIGCSAQGHGDEIMFGDTAVFPYRSVYTNDPYSQIPLFGNDSLFLEPPSYPCQDPQLLFSDSFGFPAVDFDQPSFIISPPSPGFPSPQTSPQCIWPDQSLVMSPWSSEVQPVVATERSTPGFNKKARVASDDCSCDHECKKIKLDLSDDSPSFGEAPTIPEYQAPTPKNTAVSNSDSPAEPLTYRERRAQRRVKAAKLHAEATRNAVLTAFQELCQHVNLGELLLFDSPLTQAVTSRVGCRDDSSLKRLSALQDQCGRDVEGDRKNVPSLLPFYSISQETDPAKHAEYAAKNQKARDRCVMRLRAQNKVASKKVKIKRDREIEDTQMQLIMLELRTIVLELQVAKTGGRVDLFDSFPEDAVLSAVNKGVGVLKTRKDYFRFMRGKVQVGMGEGEAERQ